MSSPLEQPRFDGRTARRDRNSDAVLDAAHELFVEGNLLPSVEEVAARSGVSLRSVYRYFPDRKELLQAALARRFQKAEPDFHLAEVGVGTLEERIEAFVAHRLTLYDRIAPTARVALSRAQHVPEIADAVERRMQQLVVQTRRHFAPELDVLPDEQAEAVLTCVELLCQFPAVDHLRAARGMSTDEAGQVLLTGVHALLEPRQPT